MKHVALVGAIAALQGVSAQGPLPDNDRAWTSVQVGKACWPNAVAPPGKTDAPCNVMARIEDLCRANGTTLAHLKAEQDCMCKGSFFQEAKGCLSCKKANAFHAASEDEHWTGVYADVKASYCGAKPTDTFYGYFAKASNAVQWKYPKNPDRVRSLAAGDTEISHYFTPEEPQGPGPFVPVPAATASVSSEAGVAVLPTAAAELDINIKHRVQIPGGGIAYSVRVTVVAEGTVKPIAMTSCSTSAGTQSTSSPIGSTSCITKSTVDPQPTGVPFPMPKNETVETHKPRHSVVAIGGFAECYCLVRGSGMRAPVELICNDYKPAPETIDRTPSKEKVEQLPDMTNCECLNEVKTIIVYKTTSVTTPVDTKTTPQDGKPGAPDRKPTDGKPAIEASTYKPIDGKPAATRKPDCSTTRPGYPASSMVPGTATPPKPTSVTAGPSGKVDAVTVNGAVVKGASAAAMAVAALAAVL